MLVKRYNAFCYWGSAPEPAGELPLTPDPIAYCLTPSVLGAPYIDKQPPPPPPPPPRADGLQRVEPSESASDASKKRPWSKPKLTIIGETAKIRSGSDTNAMELNQPGTNDNYVPTS